MIRTFIAVFALLASQICWGDSFSGRVVGVADGDTVTLLTENNEQVKVRLTSIDAPEKSQAFGKASKKSLSDLCFNKPAVVVTHGKDKYGRTIGYLSCDGINADAEQIMNGMAWVYRKYSNDEYLIALEDEAKANSIGLWSEPTPIPPWDFRHGIKPGKLKKVSADVASTEAGNTEFTCAGKRFCREMGSCEEAKFYLNECGTSRLDGDHDGTPCEALCGN